ncbi:MAG TPA: outer membrane beta-barrel protein [Candidatus Binatia bacterium]|nr:outer membrane beta-barrel protein [Candidatus Binatia bacterium]
MRKSLARVFSLLTLAALSLAMQAQTQSGGEKVPISAASSESAARTEQQEMREELKALREEVERLRAEVEHRNTSVRSTDKAEPAPAAAGPGPNAPVTSEAKFSAAPMPAPVNAPAQLSSSSAATRTSNSTVASNAPPAAAPLSGWNAIPAAPSDASPQKKEKIAPFSDWDWTWLNGNPRTKEAAFDSKFFTPEIRADLTYTYDFNKPKDNSIGGSSEIFRSNEIQLEQLGVGGDFHYDNVRARFMTQFGMYSETTPRNDPSPAKGQWDLDTAYRYISEAYGGYHFNALDGVNLDAGIFLSYIGLFSYYNFDNWAYQPSYVSSNTPWFFNGVRLQIFPNPHLKIEPWLINGWQSYGSANSRKGIGGQVKWTPRPWINVISNNYGLGHDDLYIPNRGRIHTDDSVEIKYYDHPEKTMDKMAFSFTGDMGCEFGPSQTLSNGTYLQGVGCHGNTKDPKSIGGDYFASGVNPKQSFLGFMLYNRTWFKKDKYAVTLGGGAINNPGRYLVLIPPINGETAPSAAINSPYFSGNPSDPYKAWDSSFTFDYMPSQYITFRWEYDYRHASVPYWSGAGGVTPPPGSNNGFPQYYACNSGTSSMQTSLSAAETACGGGINSVWFPDLRRDEQFIDLDILVKF